MKKIIGLLALAIFALSVLPAEAQKKAAKSETVTFVAIFSRGFAVVFLLRF